MRFNQTTNAYNIVIEDNVMLISPTEEQRLELMARRNHLYNLTELTTLQ